MAVSMKWGVLNRGLGCIVSRFRVDMILKGTYRDYMAASTNLGGPFCWCPDDKSPTIWDVD